MPWDTTMTPAQRASMKKSNDSYLAKKKADKAARKPRGPMSPMGPGSLSNQSSNRNLKGYSLTAAQRAAKTKADNAARDAKASKATVAWGPGGNTVAMSKTTGRGSGPRDGSGPRSNAGNQYAASLEKKAVTPSAVQKKAIQKAAQKRGADKMRTMDRNSRKQMGDYKGKYWGPDQFKGNQSKIDAWKKAGKPRNSDGSPKV